MKRFFVTLLLGVCMGIGADRGLAQVVAMLVNEDFDQPMGEMPPAGSDPNVDPAWRWNETEEGTETLEDNFYTGTGELRMPWGNFPENFPRHKGFNQYIDTRGYGELDVTRRYAFVCIFTFPATVGSANFGFSHDGAWPEGDTRVAMLRGMDRGILFGSITYPTFDANSPLWVNTNTTFKTGVKQGIKIEVYPGGVLKIFYQDGGNKDPLAAAWQDITPDSGMPSFNYPNNEIAINQFDGPTDGGGHLLVDHIGLSELTIVGPTPTPVPTATPKPVIGEPFEIVLDEANASKWFGGDARNTRNIGTGQSFIFPTPVHITEFGMKFTGSSFYFDYGPGNRPHVQQDLRLILAIRDESGTVVNVANTIVPADFSGGWVSFPVNASLAGQKTWIFTAWLENGSVLEATGGTPGNTEDLLPNSQGYSGGTPNIDGDLTDWSLWGTHPWDFKVMVKGEYISPTVNAAIDWHLYP